MKKADIHIGLSSYNNWYWQNIFYPEGLPRSKWFEYYCEHFDTYELNVTFYRFPTVRTLQTWFKKSPDGFLFSIKAPKIITHIKRLADCQEEIDKFYEVAREGLAEKLACVLFQLPPSFAYSGENLDRVINIMNPDFKNVVEFRNKSWWTDEVYQMLKSNGITFCTVSYPNLPEETIGTSKLGFVRLHGNKRLFYSGYDNEKLREIYKQIQNENMDEVYIYFNNTAGTEGILNALEMKTIVENSS